MKKVIKIQRCGTTGIATYRDGNFIVTKTFAASKSDAEIIAEIEGNSASPVPSVAKPLPQAPAKQPQTTLEPQKTPSPAPVVPADDDFEALRAKAAAMKIQGWGVLKTCDSLRKAIAKAEGRKV